MPKVISAQRPFTMLLGTLRQGSDPSLGPAGNPDISRTTVTMQYMPEVAVKDGPDLMPLINKSRGQTVYRGNLLEATGIGPIASGGTVLVTSAIFEGPTTLVLGQYTITTDEDYTLTSARAGYLSGAEPTIGPVTFTTT